MSQAVIGALRVTLGLDTAAFQDGIEDAQRATQKAEGRFSALGKNLSVGLAAGFAAASAAALGFGASIQKTAQDADRISKAAKTIGLTTEELSRLEVAAGRSGVSTEMLQTGMRNLSRAAADVGDGVKNGATEALRRLSVAVRAPDGSLKSMRTLLGDVAEAFSRLPEGAQKTALAMDLLGARNTSLIPLLNEGRKGLKALDDEADRLGFTFDSKTGAAAERFNDNLDRLTDRVEGVQRVLLANAIETLANLSDALVGTADEYVNFSAAAEKSAGDASAAGRKATADLKTGLDAQVSVLGAAAAEVETLYVRMARAVSDAFSQALTPKDPTQVLAAIRGAQTKAEADGLKSAIEGQKAQIEVLQDQGFPKVVVDAARNQLAKLEAQLRGIEAAAASASDKIENMGAPPKKTGGDKDLVLPPAAKGKDGPFPDINAKDPIPRARPDTRNANPPSVTDTIPIGKTFGDVDKGLTDLERRGLDVAGNIGDSLIDAFEGVVLGTEDVGDALSRIALDLLKITAAQVLDPNGGLLVGFLKSPTDKGTFPLSAAAKTAGINPAEDMFGGLTGAGGGSSPLATFVEDIGGVFDGAVGDFGGVFDGVTGDLGGIFSGLTGSLGGLFEGLLGEMGGVFEGLLGGLGGILGGAGGGGGLGLLGLLGFRTGGSFTVGGSGGPDSQLVAFWATPGEQVSVTPPALGSGSGMLDAAGAAIAPMGGGMPKTRSGGSYVGRGASDGGGSVTIAVDVSGANGDAEIERRVRAGVAAGLTEYDRRLPGRLVDIDRRLR